VPHALQGLTPERLASELSIDLTEARKVHASVQREDAPDVRLPGVRRESMLKVRSQGHVPTLELVAEKKSQIDPFVKYALKTHDGHVVETVRIPL